MNMSSNSVRFWSIDRHAGLASHVSGFVARIRQLPMSDGDLRALNADGLVAVATVRADEGSKWAVLADHAAVTSAATWLAQRDDHRSLDLQVARLAREAGEAWLQAQSFSHTVIAI